VVNHLETYVDGKVHTNGMEAMLAKVVGCRLTYKELTGEAATCPV
jgi:hypothetical protein